MCANAAPRGQATPVTDDLRAKVFFNSVRIGFSVFSFPSANSLGSWEEVLVVSYQPVDRIRD